MARRAKTGKPPTSASPAEVVAQTYLPVRFRRLQEHQGKLRPGVPPLVLDQQLVPSQPNQSLIDSIRVLQSVCFSNGPQSASEIGRALDLDPTRAHRLLRTLSLLGLAFQAKDKKFVAGPAMYVLSAQSLLNSDLAIASKGPLDELHRETKLEVALGMLWQDYVSYIYHASPDMPLDAAPGQVSMFPASMSSLGRVLMSEQSEAQVRDVYAGREVPGFESTGGVDGLLAALREARELGYARVQRKTDTGRVTIAVRIPGRGFAAIGVGGDIPKAHTVRMVDRLRAAAAAIDAALAGGTSRRTSPDL